MNIVVRLPPKPPRLDFLLYYISVFFWHIFYLPFPVLPYLCVSLLSVYNSVSFFWQIHIFLLTDPYLSFDRSLSFFWQIHIFLLPIPIFLLTDPDLSFDRSLSSFFWQIQIFLLTDPDLSFDRSFYKQTLSSLIDPPSLLVPVLVGVCVSLSLSTILIFILPLLLIFVSCQLMCMEKMRAWWKK